MAGTKINPPPLSTSIVDVASGRPTNPFTEYLHRLWKRVGDPSGNDLDQAQNDANQAQGAASNAQSTADTAATTATDAKTLATTAQSSADTARSFADTAQTTADAAAAAATAAQSSADNAQTAADTAQSTANSAQTAAAAAQDDIDKHEALTTAHGSNGAVVGFSDLATELQVGLVNMAALVADASYTTATAADTVSDAPLSYNQAYIQTLADAINDHAAQIDQLATDYNTLVDKVNAILSAEKTAGQMNTV